MEISNKFLVFLLVIAILVSIIGTWYSIDRVGKLASLTGYQTTGYVNVTIESKTEINVTQPYCGFGTGYVTEGFDYATMYPMCPGEGTEYYNWTGSPIGDPDCIVVANLGNRDAFVNVSSGKTPSSFIGGTSPNVTAWSENKETDACASGGLVNLVAFPGIEMNTSNRSMCSCLRADLNKNELYIGCYLKIPKDAVAEAKTDTWTFTAVTSQGVPDCGSD